VEALPAFPGELRQVFSNLLLNAIEAVADSGQITVRVRSSSHSWGTKGVQITIADNGAGIPPENMQRIFEPFFSTKETKGTGLGLWVSQGIVQKHGGHIRVRSSRHSDHHGTCFAIFLPYAEAEESSPAGELPVSADEMALGQGAGSGNDRTAA
jgi:signal transduction histidine kinase